MGIYYIFAYELFELLEAKYENKQGNGMFSFTFHNKNVRQTKIPKSNTDPTPLTLTRLVAILEVKSWSPEDVALQAEAEQAAEFWSDNNQSILDYLQSYDIL